MCVTGLYFEYLEHRDSGISPGLYDNIKYQGDGRSYKLKSYNDSEKSPIYVLQ